MTSDKDIEEYVTNTYNPHIQTPEEYMNSTNWGSGERQRVAFNRAQDLYDLIPEEEKETEQQEPEQETPTDGQGEGQQEEEQEEEQNIFEKIYTLGKDFLNGLFGG